MPDYDPKSIPILDDVIESGIIEETDSDDKHRAPIIDIKDMEDELSVDDGTINLFSSAPVELSPEDAIIEDGTAGDSHIGDLDADDSGPSIGTIDSLDDSPGNSLDDSPADTVDVTSPVNMEEEISSSYHTQADMEAADLEDNEVGDVEEAPFESALIDYHDDAYAVEEADDQIISGVAQSEHDHQAGTGDVADSVTEQTAATIEAQATHATQTAMSLAVDDIVEDVVNDIVSQLVPDLQQQLRYLVKQALDDRLPAAIIGENKTETDQSST